MECDYVKLLKDLILEKGRVINNDVLKVDSFINHQVDSKLMKEIGLDFFNHFKSNKITRVFTIESSGIAPALMTSYELEVPLVILKKQTSSILSDNIYQTKIKSFTKNIIYNLTLSKNYISPNDNILIIDDFLANGEAAKGAINLIEQAGARVCGIGIVIEKSFQLGRKTLDDLGYNVYSLARIKSLKNSNVEFCD